MNTNMGCIRVSCAPFEPQNIFIECNDDDDDDNAESDEK